MSFHTDSKADIIWMMGYVCTRPNVRCWSQSSTTTSWVSGTYYINPMDAAFNWLANSWIINHQWQEWEQAMDRWRVMGENMQMPMHSRKKSILIFHCCNTHATGLFNHIAVQSEESLQPTAGSCSCNCTLHWFGNQSQDYLIPTRYPVCRPRRVERHLQLWLDVDNLQAT